MSQKCPQCGATIQPNQQCRDLFNLCLAVEFEHPTTYGIVHHLTVTNYMLQHNEYSEEVWLEARQMLVEFVQHGITPADVRRRNRSRFDSRNRKWSVTKGAKLSEFDAIVWSRTISDVRLDNPEIYCTDIKLWGVSILADTAIFSI